MIDLIKGLKHYKHETTVYNWNPDNETFWDAQGKYIAYANLIVNVYILFLGYAIWQLWSPISPLLPELGYNFDTNLLFWLASIPALSGGTFRILYTFIYGEINNRKFSSIATIVMTIPLISLLYCLLFPRTPYWFCVLSALSAGVAGGMYTYTMSAVSYFFPKKLKSTTLGITGGLGNLGVSSVHFSSKPIMMLPPIVGTTYKSNWYSAIAPQNIAVFWLFLLLIGYVLNFFFCTNIINAKANINNISLCDCNDKCEKCLYKSNKITKLNRLKVILKSYHFYIISLLYISAFGTYLGFSVTFPLLVRYIFPDINPYKYSWIAPLLGALSRPIGGYLGDKYGCAVITQWTLFAMMLNVISILFAVPNTTAVSIGYVDGSFPLFLFSIILITSLSGIANGSITGIIPVVYNKLNIMQADDTVVSQLYWQKEGMAQTAIVIGLTSAISTYGSFIVPKAHGTSIALTGSMESSLYCFVIFYAISFALCTYFYTKNHLDQTPQNSLTEA